MYKKILEHFKKVDPVLYSWAIKTGKLEIIVKDKPENYFYRLCYEIIGQQLSDKSSSAIFGRFKKLFPRKKFTAKDIIALSHEKLRGTGMSHAKARYVRNLAEAIDNKSLVFEALDNLSDEEVMKQLTSVKGIGPWTAEMFLMFTLAREDVFSHGDLGLRKGLMKIYKLRKKPSHNKVETIVTRWSPYKTYASRVLWASLELQ